MRVLELRRSVLVSERAHGALAERASAARAQRARAAAAAAPRPTAQGTYLPYTTRQQIHFKTNDYERQKDTL